MDAQVKGGADELFGVGSGKPAEPHTAQGDFGGGNNAADVQILHGQYFLSAEIKKTNEQNKQGQEPQHLSSSLYHILPENTIPFSGARRALCFGRVRPVPGRTIRF